VRAHFGVRRASIVGWSYLGAVVALYAAKYPDHVEGVLQVGPAALRSETATAKERRGSVPDQKDLEHLEKLRQEGMPTQDPVAYCREWLKLQLLPQLMGTVCRPSQDEAAIPESPRTQDGGRLLIPRSKAPRASTLAVAMLGGTRRSSHPLAVRAVSGLSDPSGWRRNPRVGSFLTRP
jgi:pimeloyl-ACP methyl ester carboxylesterase